MSKKSLRVLVGVAGVLALTLSLLSPAGAGHKDSHAAGDGGGSNDNVCPGEHLYPDGNDPVIIEAPPGEVILSYCAKAGSGKNNNCGPITVVFTGNYETSIDITDVCPGKRISHYSFETGPEPEPPTTTAAPSTTAAPTTTTPEPEPESDPEDPTGVLGAGAANAQVGTPSFTG